MFIYDRRLVLLILLSIMAAIAMAPSGAFAESEKTTFQQEFTYGEGETPNIPQEISQFGQVFTLVSVTEPVATSSLPKSRSYTYRVSAGYTPEQLSQAPVNARLTPIYGLGKRQVDRRETIRELPDNDVDRLQKRKAYKDTNGRGPGAGSRGELTLAEVRYEPMGWDEYGLPDNYTAHVVYRGEESYRKLLYYEAVSTYTDTVAEEGVSAYTVVATYEGPAPPDDDAVDELAAVPTGEDPEPGEPAPQGAESTASAPGENSFRFPFSFDTLSPLGAAAIATMAAAVLTLFFLGVYNRRRMRESAAG